MHIGLRLKAVAEGLGKCRDLLGGGIGEVRARQEDRGAFVGEVKAPLIAVIAGVDDLRLSIREVSAQGRVPVVEILNRARE